VHHKTDGAIDGVVCESFIVETLYPQQLLMTVVLGRIHTLMMASNVWQSDQQQVQDRCPQFLLDINKDPCCRMQPDSITLSPAEAAIIYFHKITTLPPPTTIKRAVKNNSK
jgi:hypothetical protein